MTVRLNCAPRTGRSTQALVVDLWCYSGTAKNGAKIPAGFSFTLCGIQFVEDGDPIGGASVAKDDDFDDLKADDDPDFTDIP